MKGKCFECLVEKEFAAGTKEPCEGAGNQKETETMSVGEAEDIVLTPSSGFRRPKGTAKL